MLHTLAFWAPNGFELIVVLVVALLLFGKRLPDVARSLGKGIVEFKKGVKGIEDDVDKAQYEQSDTPRGKLYSGSGEGSQEADSLGSPKS